MNEKNEIEKEDGGMAGCMYVCTVYNWESERRRRMNEKKEKVKDGSTGERGRWRGMDEYIETGIMTNIESGKGMNEEEDTYGLSETSKTL